MGTKNILSELQAALDSGEVTKEQVLKVLKADNEVVSTQKKNPINVQKIFYYVGGLVLLVGILFFVGQYWSTMSAFSRMILVVGATISTYALGYYFYTATKIKEVGRALLGISAVLLPLGVTTTLAYLGFTEFTSEGAVMVSAFLFMIYFASYYFVRAGLFLPFAYIAATSAFFNLVGFLLKQGWNIPNDFEYRFLIAGAVYLLTTQFFKKDRDWKVQSLYFFGSEMVLGAMLVFQGDKFNGSVPWTLAFLISLIVTYYASVKVQSKILLVVATLFTFAQIFKWTAEYFSDSIGWPISLMFAGIMMMGVGYLSFKLNKEFEK